MITDCWDGLGVYRSEDFTNWTRCGENILKQPGSRPWDTLKGNHADILTINDRAYIFYFSRPFVDKDSNVSSYESNRNAIQVAELEIKDGTLVCDRDKEFTLDIQRK